jgi:hypothetical protein
MRTLVLALAVILVSCGGVSPDEEVASVGQASPITSQAPAPVTTCFTCSHGLDSPTCDLCAMCKSPYFASIGITFSVVTGCLPEGNWCGLPHGSTCKSQDCSLCP